MSKDWTPFELVMADIIVTEERGTPLHDSQIVFVDEGGNETTLWNDEARKEFPNTSFLLDGFEFSIYEELHKDGNETERNVYDSFKYLEQQLSQIVHYIEQQHIHNDTINMDELNVPFVIKDWFLGQLAKNFYYNTENNELLYSFIYQYAVCMNNPTLKEEYEYFQEHMDIDSVTFADWCINAEYINMDEFEEEMDEYEEQAM